MFIVRVINVHHQYHQNPESLDINIKLFRVCSVQCVIGKVYYISMLCHGGLGIDEVDIMPCCWAVCSTAEIQLQCACVTQRSHHRRQKHSWH